MKAIIFAGGVGTRLWPLSRKKSPKQFEKIVDNKSTLQLTVDRIIPQISLQDIYISTGQQYVEIIKKQLPDLPEENIITEPEKKDVGPAVALAIGHLQKKFPDEAVIILWSDHLIKKESQFIDLLRKVEEVIKSEPEKIIFIGHKPRFASENLGWIEYGSEIKKLNGLSLYQFINFKYKPDARIANQFFKSGHHAWNLGYWVTTPRFMYSLYKRFAPQIWQLTEKIVSQIGQRNYQKSLDHAIAEQLDSSITYVITIDIGWTDIGAWEALKNALEEKREDNVVQGKVHLDNCTDSLIYNYNDKTLVVGMDLEDCIVINTKDVILVTKKTSVPKITKLVESFKGTEHEDLT